MQVIKFDDFYVVASNGKLVGYMDEDTVKASGFPVLFAVDPFSNDFKQFFKEMKKYGIGLGIGTIYYKGMKIPIDSSRLEYHIGSESESSFFLKGIPRFLKRKTLYPSKKKKKTTVLANLPRKITKRI